MDNTENYETPHGSTYNSKGLDGVEILTAVQTLDDYIDEKCMFSAVAPSDAPAVLTWNNVSVSTKPARGKEPKNIINNINGCISGGLWGIMGASGIFHRWCQRHSHYHIQALSNLCHENNLIENRQWQNDISLSSLPEAGYQTDEHFGRHSHQWQTLRQEPTQVHVWLRDAGRSCPCPANSSGDPNVHSSA